MNSVLLVISFIISVIIVVLLMPLFIPFLHRIKFGQSIREEGPSWHQKKDGTPTMGGLVLIAAVLTAGLVTCRSAQMVMMLAVCVGFGVIGFLDDYIKVVLHRNLGLTSLQKFLLQLILTVFYIVTFKNLGYLDSHVIIPFMPNTIDLGVFYIPIAAFVILAVVNSVNLTDGIDGLAGSVTSIVAIFFVVAGLIYKHTDSTLLALTTVGACCAFLVFNKYPAKIFMGDTGSLFLGGVISVVALSLKMPIFLILVGIVYLIEALSVIIQVAVFKSTGKRVFKMSPIHHHFEMCGFNENKIVYGACVITFIFCLIAVFAFLPNAM